MCLLLPKNPVLQRVRMREEGNRRQRQGTLLHRNSRRKDCNFDWKTEAAVCMTKKGYLPNLIQHRCALREYMQRKSHEKQLYNYRWSFSASSKITSLEQRCLTEQSRCSFLLLLSVSPWRISLNSHFHSSNFFTSKTIYLQISPWQHSL